MLREDGMKNRTEWAVRLIVLAILCWASPSAKAQASSYVPPVIATSSVAVSATGLPGSLGNVALDSCGDIYTINAGNGQVVEIPFGGGAATTVLGSNSYGSMSFAIDAAKANLFVMQGYSGSVTQIPISACVPNPSAKASVGIGNLGAISYYWGGSAVATDPSGNLFIATNGACCAASNELLEQYAANKYQAGSTLLASLSNPITSMAADASGDIFFASGGALYELAVTTPATSSAAAVYSATPVQIGSGFVSVVGVSFDAAGDLYVADQGTGGYYASNGYYPELYLSSILYVIPNEKSGLNPADRYIVVQGSGPANPLTFASAVAVAPAGNLFFADGGADNSVYDLTQGSGSFGAVALASNGAATVNVTFNAAETTGAIQFAPSSTITSTGGTCAANTAYTAGTTCTITAQFTPATPGTATGGFAIAGSGGTTLATVDLEGIGQGAGLTIDPGAPSSFGSGLKSPMSVAIDGAGDTFFADAGNNAVIEFPNGTPTPVSIGTGLSKPAGVAVDGAGDVLIADTGNNRVVEVPMVNGALSASAQTAFPSTLAGTALNAPSGLAVDGAGDLFIADTGNNRVVAVPYSGSWNTSAATALGSSLTGPLAVAVDLSGNLYVANSGAGQIEKILYPLYQPSQELVAVGFGKPTGLAVDASGSLFVADVVDGEIERIPNVAGNLNPNAGVEAGIGIDAPYGVALDPLGNLYVSDSTAGAGYQVNRIATTLTFGDWAVSSTSGVLAAQLEDEGNAPLLLSTPYDAASGNTGDFSLSTTESNACADGGTVAIGTSCELDATFTPTAQNSRAEVVQIASNAGNGAAQLTLAGNGSTTAATTTTLAITAPAGGAPFFGQPITLTATVAASSGTPTGSVTLLVDGAQNGVATLSSSRVATFQLASGLTGGNHSLIAIYGGTSAFNGSVSAVLTITVTQAPTVTTLTTVTPYVNPLSVVAGGSVSLTATISSTGVGIPTGTVTFKSNGTAVGTAPVLPVAGGLFEAAISTTTLVTGSNSIVAIYPGDANYIGSTSAATTVTVVSSPQATLSASGTTITSSANSSGTVTFTATSYGGWNGLVGFNCLGSSLPANARCVFSPGQIQVMPSTPTTSASNPTVALSVTVNQPPQTPTASGFAWWLAVPAGLLLYFARRRFARRALTATTMAIALLLLGISTLGLGGCNNGAQFITTPGTTTVTVYASSDPFTTLPSSGTPTPGVQTCGINPKTSQPDPTLAPCSQTAFQVTVTVN